MPRKRSAKVKPCGTLVPDAHGTQSACDDGAIDPIAVPDHVTRGTVPRKSLNELPPVPVANQIRTY